MIKSLPLPVQTALLAIVVGSIVGGGVGYVGGQSLNKQNERQYKERQEVSDKYWDAIKHNKNDDNERNDNLSNAVIWVNAMQSMPASQARTDMASSILKTLEDNVITIDENKALSAQFKQLEDTNVNQRTKENAIKIRDGKNIVDDRDLEQEKRKLTNEYLSNIPY